MLNESLQGGQESIDQLSRKVQELIEGYNYRSEWSHYITLNQYGFVLVIMIEVVTIKIVTKVVFIVLGTYIFIVYIVVIFFSCKYATSIIKEKSMNWNYDLLLYFAQFILMYILKMSLFLSLSFASEVGLETNKQKNTTPLFF